MSEYILKLHLIGLKTKHQITLILPFIRFASHFTILICPAESNLGHLVIGLSVTSVTNVAPPVCQFQNKRETSTMAITL